MYQLVLLTMVIDYGLIKYMQTIAISKFKATCLAVLEQVRKTRRPLRVTRFGKPIADIVPPSPEISADGWLGCMHGTLSIDGDIISPISSAAEWEVLQKK
ncbi:MAG: type II toxin-antitoxin system Phd/YefM family antitoxin [Deltaproteobacteria bacterium]|nr:type II toxin-antitoxin system Phd/YefM family antitoxin [Deltaproteobacteria bacterium]